MLKKEDILRKDAVGIVENLSKSNKLISVLSAFEMYLIPGESDMAVYKKMYPAFDIPDGLSE